MVASISYSQALASRVSRWQSVHIIYRLLVSFACCVNVYALSGSEHLTKTVNSSASSSTITVTYSNAYTGTEVLQAGPAPFSVSTPANTVLTNNAPYNARIARLTDTQTTASGVSFTVPGGGGSDGVVTNEADTLIAVESLGGEAFVFGFNSGTMQIWPGSAPPTTCSGASAFSRNDPKRWYCLPSGGTKLYAVDFAVLTNRQCGSATCYDPTNATWTLITDFATCPQAPTGNPTWTSMLGVGAGDIDVSISISWEGGQGTGHLFFNYLVGPHTCTTYDTLGNGTSPEWYTKNGVPNVLMDYLTGTPLQASWTIHDSWTNGTWAMVSMGQCVGQDCGSTDGGPVINLPTHTGYVLSDYAKTSGHHTMSATMYYNDLNPLVDSRSLTNPVSYSEMSMFSCTPCEDAHLSGDVLNDANPVLGSRGGIATTTWTVPYMNEVFGIATDGSGTIYRFSPTWSSGTATNFYGQYAITGFSHDRTKAFLTSDMNCQLRTDCGTDVFAIDLIVK